MTLIPKYIWPVKENEPLPKKYSNFSFSGTTITGAQYHYIDMTNYTNVCLGFYKTEGEDNLTLKIYGTWQNDENISYEDSKYFDITESAFNTLYGPLKNKYQNQAALSKGEDVNVNYLRLEVSTTASGNDGSYSIDGKRWY